MPDNSRKEDLRIIKTHKALVEAMSQGLELRNFNKITVHDLCQEAQISRATFYAHFADKYDLLRYWLKIQGSTLPLYSGSYDELEQAVNNFAAAHQRSIRNLLEEANGETSELLCDFFISLFGEASEKNTSMVMEARQTVLNRFCAGGIYNFLLWQVKNKFPVGVPLLNPHLYAIVKGLCQDEAEVSQ